MNANLKKSTNLYLMFLNHLPMAEMLSAAHAVLTEVGSPKKNENGGDLSLHQRVVWLAKQVLGPDLEKENV